MKKLILSCFIILSLLLQVSCGQGEMSKAVASPYPTEGRETKLVPDESLTGELTVSLFLKDYSKLSGQEMGDQVNAATEKFQELYPNVKLTIERGGNDPNLKYGDYCTKLTAEIMAGDGPDIFQIASGMDANKMMRSGKLADLRSYFENDKSFNIADYNEIVFSGGQPEGKQYVVPTGYFVPFFMSTKEALEVASFDVNKCKTFDGAIDELDKLLKNISNERTRESLWNPPFVVLDPAIYVSPSYIDFDNTKIDLSSPKLKKALELSKNYFSDSLENPIYRGPGSLYGSALNWKENKAVLVEYGIEAFWFIMKTASFATREGQTPTIFALPNENDGVTASAVECYAVRSSSTNIQQAYNFLKILINFETQTAKNYEPFQIPISNKAQEIFFAKFKEETENQYYDESLGLINLPPVSDEFINSYKEIIEKINYIFYDSGKINSIFRQEMLPYYKGEKTYEECINSAQATFEVYVSE